MVNQDDRVEDMHVDENQDNISNPDDMTANSEEASPVNDEATQAEATRASESVSSESNESDQSVDAPTWAEAEIESDDDSMDIVDAPDDQSAGEQVVEERRTEAAPSGELQALVDALNKEIALLKATLEDRNGQYVRIAADFENFRKRTQKERSDLEQQVKCSAISDLLPVVDNFERARSQIKPQTDAEMNIHKSYQSVYKQLVDCLKRIGVSPMRAEGMQFDPNLHEAVMREPTDQHPEGTVLEELMRGYMLGERVIRHAMVKVAAEPEDAPPSSSSEESQGNS